MRWKLTYIPYGPAAASQPANQGTPLTAHHFVAIRGT
jgi:hypothetical protein